MAETKQLIVGSRRLQVRHSSPARKRRWRHRHREAIAALLFLSPALLFFAIFKWYPMIDAARISLYHENLLTKPKYAGLANYDALLHDPTFHNAILTSFLYVLGVTMPVWLLALALALVFNRPGRTRSVFRVLFFLPTLGSTVVVAIIWKFLYNPRGLINGLLSAVGINGPNWLTGQHTALLALVIMGIWQVTPYFMVIYLAGLKDIPEDFYEAASLDGAGRWQVFRHLTLPLLKPTFVLVVVYSIIVGLRNFINPLVVTNGGPVNATRVLPLLIYQTGFEFSRMGYASAMSIVYLAIMMIVTVFQLRLFRQMRPAEY